MPEDLLLHLPSLYADMENQYADIAATIGLTCTDCPRNCCTSYFQHHTHVEWAYLWQGLATLPDTLIQKVRSRAAQYVEQARRMLAAQCAPDIMCPLNEDGRCILYAHRMMICRLHGVPNVFTLPNGVAKDFPGCFRSQELAANSTDLPRLDRTDFYRRLAALEMDYLRSMTQKPAKVRLTLAELIHQGPPV